MKLDKIAMILSTECQLDDDKRWVVGVSGGPDSICLLHVLHCLGCNVVTVHVNHKLRPEADGEAESVEAFAKNLGVEFISCAVDVYTYASDQGLSIEEAARELRYQTLFEQAEKMGAPAVLVAHNADDQVETILMHLLRGSGLVGLRGMDYRKLPNPWSERIALVRPFISTWRAEIQEYILEHHLRVFSDQSNFDTTFFRNRLRHELLPYLEQYNPHIRENLLRMSIINKEDYAVLQKLVADAWQENLIEQGPGYVSFHLQGFRRLPEAIQRYLLRKAIAHHLPSLRDINFESIQRGIHYLSDDQLNGQADLIAGLRLVKEADVFWLATWQVDLPGSEFPSIMRNEMIHVAIPSTIDLANGWLFQVDLEKSPWQPSQSNRAYQDPFQIWLDLEDLPLPLTLRTRRSGERFRPLGMQGHSLKVSDLMVNFKIPSRVRSTWPLLCSGDEILWIPGYRQSHLGRLTPGSRHIAHFILSRTSGA